MECDVRIRVASSTDSDEISSLLRITFPALMRSSYDSEVLTRALPLMTQAQPQLLESGSYYVAESSDGAIIGCGGWTRERPGTGEITAGLGHVRHFGVRRDWIRRGVGRAIYARCKRDAREAGVTQIECYSSLNGEAFYAALGFARLAQINVDMPDGVLFPSVHMVVDL